MSPVTNAEKVSKKHLEIKPFHCYRLSTEVQRSYISNLDSITFLKQL